jgi:hypothetical protein
VIYCCTMMQTNVEGRCDKHPDPFDCLDNLIRYNPRDDRYGLIVHDGGGSSVLIKYCPWCGKDLGNDS